MQIKSNTLLKVLVPVVLFIAIAIGVKSCGSGTPPVSSTVKTNTVADLTDEELQILGIEGDTPEDTLRTLVARLKVIQGDVQHESYIASWLKALKEDKKAIFQASRFAREAFEYLILREQALAAA